ncbi:MAG: hypothetical protein JW751_06785 [Polyangiaceae bacterium]|nr:hypothetical protein [Polyangiaceae bacterium]
MTEHEPDQLPAPFEALLAAWPVADRTDEEWDRSARCVLSRLGGTRAPSPADVEQAANDLVRVRDAHLDDDALLAPPLPREPKEPVDWSGPRAAAGARNPEHHDPVEPSNGAAKTTGRDGVEDRRSSPRLLATAARRPSSPDLSLAELARSKVAESDRERRILVAKQSLDHVARARSRGEIADTIARTAEARGGERPSQVTPIPQRRRGWSLRLVGGTAVGLLATAAAVLLLHQRVQHPPVATTAVLVAASGAATADPATAAPKPVASQPALRTAPAGEEELVAKLDDLPPAATETIQDAPIRTGKPMAAARAAAGPPASLEARVAPTEEDEFDTRLQHAEGRSTPLAPTTGEAIAALAPSLSAAKLCVAGHTDPSTAVITFGSDGTVSTVSVSGPAAATPAGSCIEAAFKSARVAPFAKPSFSVSYPVRP